MSELKSLCADLRADRPDFKTATANNRIFRDRSDVETFARALKKNTHLRRLILHGCFRENPDLAADPLLEDAITSHPTLRRLSLGFNNSVTTAAAEAAGRAASNSQTLRLLSMHCNRLGDEGARALAAGLNGDGGGGGGISQTSRLEELDLCTCQIRDEGAEALASMIVGRAAPEKLVLCHNTRIGVQGYCALGTALHLQQNEEECALKELNLRNNFMKYLGLRAFLLADGSGGGINSQLEVLNLSFNAIEDRGCRLVSNALKESTPCSLRELHLTHNLIGPEGVSVLADGLLCSKGCSLEFLYLNANRIGEEGCAALASALTIDALKEPLCCRLRMLNLNNCSIGPEGARALANGFLNGKGCSLEVLCLVSNSIGEEGCAALASGLTIGNLKELRLDSNAIGDRGATALASKCLVEGGGASPSLEVLSLNRNQISLEGCRAIAMALRQNSSLKGLEMYNNNVLNEGAALLEEESLRHCNWSLEMLVLEISFEDGSDSDTSLSQERLLAIRKLLVANFATKEAHQKLVDDKRADQKLPLAIWPQALELINQKPDLLFSVLKNKTGLV